jgi:hypothetical protein
MPSTIGIHPGARQKFPVWRRSLPNFPANRDDLMRVYLEQIGHEALKAAIAQGLPRIVEVAGPFNADFRSSPSAHSFCADIQVFLAKSAIDSARLWGIYFAIRRSGDCSFGG